MNGGYFIRMIEEECYSKFSALITEYEFSPMTKGQKAKQNNWKRLSRKHKHLFWEH